MSIKTGEVQRATQQLGINWVTHAHSILKTDALSLAMETINRKMGKESIKLAGVRFTRPWKMKQEPELYDEVERSSKTHLTAYWESSTNELRGAVMRLV